MSEKWVNVPQNSTVLAGLAQGDEFDEHYGYGPPQAAGLSWRSVAPKDTHNVARPMSTQIKHDIKSLAHGPSGGS